MASSPCSDLPEVHTTGLPEVGSTDLPEVTPIELFFGDDIFDINFPQTLSTERSDGVDSHDIIDVIGSNNDAHPATEIHNEGQGTRTICGLGRRLFFVLAAIGAIIIVGGAVGGSLGGTLGKSHSTSTSTLASSPTVTVDKSPSSTSSSYSISAKSNIASINFTDPGGYDHYYVFHQDQTNNIIASVWDSQNTTWKAKIIKATGMDLEIIRGTPIAAVAWSTNDSDHHIQVFFLLSGNLLSGLETFSAGIDATWLHHELGSQILINTGKGSNIAAWHPNGGNSTWPPTVMIWQSNQEIMYSTSNDWEEQQSSSIVGINGTGLALTSVGNNDAIQWRFYYDDSNVLQEYKIEPDFTSSKPGQIFQTLASNSESRISATSFDKKCILVINLEQDGSPKARWWMNPKEKWKNSEAPNLLNSPKTMLKSPHFTAIAAHNGQRVYGIVDGSIHEWKFDPSTPMTWIYVGQVTTDI